MATLVPAYCHGPACVIGVRCQATTTIIPWRTACSTGGGRRSSRGPRDSCRCSSSAPASGRRVGSARRASQRRRSSAPAAPRAPAPAAAALRGWPTVQRQSLWIAQYATRQHMRMHAPHSSVTCMVSCGITLISRRRDACIVKPTAGSVYKPCGPLFPQSQLSALYRLCLQPYGLHETMARSGHEGREQKTTHWMRASRESRHRPAAS